MLAVPCPPPRRSQSHYSLAVAARMPNSRSDTYLSRRLSEDPAIHLEALLRHHRLPETRSFEPRRVVEHDDFPDHVPHAYLRMSESLLTYISRHLAEVASTLAPQPINPLIPGPSKEDTDRFAEVWDALSERGRLAASARRLFSSTVADTEFIIKFFLRPANDLMSCMLLPTGLQVFWRLADQHHLGSKPRFELVWCPGDEDEDEDVLCVLEVTAPDTVSDSDMQFLVENLRRGFFTVHDGRIALFSPHSGEIRPWIGACKLASRAISDMLDSNATLALITNCNRFIAISMGQGHDNTPVFNFSDLVAVSGVPEASFLCRSPLGLFLGMAVHALQQRGVRLSPKMQGNMIPPTSLVLANLLKEQFGPTPVSKRRSHDAKFRRRAIFGEGMYPSQLGASMFYLRVSPGYKASMGQGVKPTCWPSPFHGAFAPTFLPNLLHEATPLEASWVPALEIVALRGAGRLWRVFTARFPWLKAADADVVVKVVSLSSFEPLSVLEAGFSRDDAAAAIINELGIYTGPLEHLQGSVIPRFHGLFGSAQLDDTQQWCALFGDAGVVLPQNERWYASVRHTVRRHYEAIHAAGVLHNDVGWHHVLRRTGDAALWLVDFDRATTRTTETDVEWDRLCLAEMDKVDVMLVSGLHLVVVPPTPTTTPPASVCLG